MACQVTPIPLIFQWVGRKGGADAEGGAEEVEGGFSGDSTVSIPV